jgi:hypothetical protein
LRATSGELKVVLGPPRGGPEGFVLVGTRIRDDGVHLARASSAASIWARGKATSCANEHGGRWCASTAWRRPASSCTNTRDTAWKHYVDIVDLNTVEHCHETTAKPL